VVWQRLAIRHGKNFARHVVPAVMKPARTLWNELIGFIFCCLAVLFGIKAANLAMAVARPGPNDGPSELFHLAIALFCTILMLWFGIGSFLRARKISRS
jgi:hypothetical protein